MFSFFNKIRKTAFLSTFIASYKYMKTQDASDEDALQKAITGFAYRRPFNVLTEDDISWLAKNFAALPDPKALGMIPGEMDTAGDATGLKKREIILKLIEDIRKMQEDGKYLL